MYAVFTEVDVPTGAPTHGAAAALQANAVPAVRAAGARHAYWTGALNGRALGLVLFDSEAAARAASEQITVGHRPGSAPDGVTYRTVEVREVIAQV